MPRVALTPVATLSALASVAAAQAGDGGELPQFVRAGQAAAQRGLEPPAVPPAERAERVSPEVGVHVVMRHRGPPRRCHVRSPHISGDRGTAPYPPPADRRTRSMIGTGLRRTASAARRVPPGQAR